MNLSKKRLTDDITIHFRMNTSDEFVLEEVLTNRIYRRSRPAFDVQPKEHWLDLGANIGAFALYCRMRGATAECYEPDPACFDILTMNAPDFQCWCRAITNSHEKLLPFWKGRKFNNFTKATTIHSSHLPRHPQFNLMNEHGSILVNRQYDGVKMDIEGSEGPLIDEWLLPRTNKLCMEYHSSRDPSVSNLKRRLDILRQHFAIVHYPPEFDRIIAADGNDKYHGQQLSYFDRMIFCIGAL